MIQQLWWEYHLTLHVQASTVICEAQQENLLHRLTEDHREHIPIGLSRQQTVIADLGWECLCHRGNWPDLAPCDFFVCKPEGILPGSLKLML